MYRICMTVLAQSFPRLFIYFNVFTDRRLDYHKQKLLYTCFLDLETIWRTLYLDPLPLALPVPDVVVSEAENPLPRPRLTQPVIVRYQPLSVPTIYFFRGEFCNQPSENQSAVIEVQLFPHVLISSEKYRKN